jgi:hypothetical protein
MKSFFIKSAVVGLLGAATLPAGAADLHAGDIELSVTFGALGVGGYHELEYGTGIPIFEGALNTLLAGPSGPRWRGTNPGFDSEPGTFQVTDVVSVRPVVYGTGLDFWNGSSWQDLMPRNETLELRDTLDETAIFDSVGFTQSADFQGAMWPEPDGAIHQHFTFTLSDSPSGLPGPTMGAYRILLQASSPNYAPSTPFYIVFNRGLGEEQFEEAIHAMAVPEPGTYAMLGLGLGVIAMVARRRKA